MMFTPTDVAKVVYVVEQSGAAGILSDLLPKKKSGRRSGFTETLFLIGALLSALVGDGMVLTDIHSILTQQMDRDWQVRLGIRDSIGSAPNFSEDSVHRFSRRVRDGLEFGYDSAPGLSPQERANRRAGAYLLINAMLNVTLIPTRSRYRGIDATGIWSWARNLGRRGLSALLDELEVLKKDGKVEDAKHLAAAIERLTAEMKASEGKKNTKKRAAKTSTASADSGDPDGEDEPDAPDGDDSGKESLPHDRDARSGAKTGKDGSTEWFFGYMVHAVVRVAEPGDPYTSEPNLIERLVVAPGVRELVESSNQLLDSLPVGDGEELVIIGDRAYSNMTEDNWSSRLRELGFTQVIDMREDHQKWTDVDSMRVTAGWPHCPATPDHFESITKPTKGRDDFHVQISERERYGMVLHAQNSTGRRFTCPALGGKLRCPLRPETMASRELPLVQNPPDARTAPKCCTARTVTVRFDDPNARGRLWQDDYWGTPQHTRKMNRRTSIEQTFSKLKSPDMHDMGRGFVRVTGLARVTLAVGFISIAHNIRALETFADRHNADGREVDHPLMQARQEYVVLHLDEEEAAEFEAFRQSRRPARRQAAGARSAA